MTTYFLVVQAMREEVKARRRRRQQTRDDFSLARLPEPEFINNYRLTKTLFEEVCKDIVPLLPFKRNITGIDPVQKILIALNFYARGSYQGAVGKDSDVPMAQQTVSRCIRVVTEAFNQPHILAKYVRFPQTRQERTTIKSRFYDKYRIPGVCGCIDCTHIAIKRPTEYEERFFNRKSYHSLNVQVICDADNFILNVDARFGGSTHDSFIFNESHIKTHLEGLAAQGETAILLGDSGYPLREYLLTPYSEPGHGQHWEEGSPEAVYNNLQKKARSTIERTFGILKARFRCLLAARQLAYCPERAGQICIACCVLHNMCTRENIDFPELTIQERQQELDQQQIQSENNVSTSAAHALQRGQLLRANMAQQLARQS